LDEPLERWQHALVRYKAAFRAFFDKYDIARIHDLTPEQTADIFAAPLFDLPRPARGQQMSAEDRKLRKEKLGAALRYLAGPPISEDDLRVLADCASIAPGFLRNDPQSAKRVLGTIAQALDKQRLPWIAEKRTPTEMEREAAVLASAILITAQRVSTDRRSQGKNDQERAVKSFLARIGFREVSPRPMPTLENAPVRGDFCAESLVGSRKSDVTVRLFDGRLMPMECKVSNSTLNSIKRINNDAAVKATRWRDELGRNQVVPVAVLSGVFRVESLLRAQEGGLTLFWAHDLDPLRIFVESTRAVD
jgi:hypothetical protein